MWTLFKVFIEFVTVLLLFYVLLFSPRGMWHLSSLIGIEPPPPALEGKVLTRGPPGKSLNIDSLKWLVRFNSSIHLISSIYKYNKWVKS